MIASGSCSKDSHFTASSTVLDSPFALFVDSDSPRIAAELAKYPNRTFYQSLNPVKSACYARAQHERLVERPKETTSGRFIVFPATACAAFFSSADALTPLGRTGSASIKIH